LKTLNHRVLKSFVILALIISILAGSTSMEHGQNSGVRLKVGDWWSLKGSSHRASNGYGFGVGGMTEDTQYTDKFIVTSLDSNKITISYHWTESWTGTATGNWEKDQDGSDSGTSEYILDLGSLNVVDGTEGAKDWIGYPVWFLANPVDLRGGGTIQRGAWVLSNDAKSNILKLVAWSVDGSQIIQIKNYAVTAWSLSFTGPRRGAWAHQLDSSSYDYSTGSETITYLFDSVYGTQVGVSRSGDFKLERSDGGFTETYSETMQFDDTNLDFSAPTTSTSSHTTEATSTSTVVTQVVTQTVVAQPFSIGGTGLMATIGIVAVIAIVAAWLVMRSRSKPRPESVAAEKFCIECGQPLRADQKYCTKCGKAQS
jgi:hypothetical protein